MKINRDNAHLFGGAKRYKKIGFCPYLILVVMLAIGGGAQAADEPFDGPANWGGTGIMEVPTARVLHEGRVRAGVAQADPYRYYYGAFSPLKGLEIEGRVTENLDLDISYKPGWSGYGYNKDKALDVKYQFHPEGKWTPALAIGIMDPHGTRIYASQYVVASKQIYPFDFTLGFGNGRFGKRPLPSQGEGIKIEMFSDNASWRSDGQFFWGIQMALTDEIMLMAEYNPIDYPNTGDPSARVGTFAGGVPSKYNFGIRWRPWKWLETDVSWQRGDQLGLNVSVAFDVGKPMIPIYDPLYKEKPELRLGALERRITRGLQESGFSDIIVLEAGDRLQVEAQNNRYYYTPRALFVMLRVVETLSPPGVREIRLILSENGIPVVAFKTLKEDAGLLFTEKLTAKQFLSLSGGMDTEIAAGLPGERMDHQRWDYRLKPSFRTFLNDPSGFFKYRLGVLGSVSLFPWKGGSFVTGIEWYLLNTVSSVNEPSATPVRTDMVPYQQKDFVLGILMAEQFAKFPKRIYGRISGGFLETQYAGIDAEVAKPFLDGRVMLGLSGSVVKKRDPDEIFGFKDNDFKKSYETAFVNTRLNLPEVEGAIDLKMGRFLAGDQGMRVTVSKFFNGVVLSAWYSRTDTDIFSDNYNRGYHDKGIAVTIPLRLFTGKDSKVVYNFGISPWTRDVAQDIEHFNTLFDYIGRDTDIFLKKDAPTFK